MSTTSKGDIFERKIFDFLKHEIEEGRFFVEKDNCKIYHKKGYYSKDRGKEIVFDISIEIFIPGQTEYTILYIVECKDYGHAIPVDDAEEFYAKIQQIPASKGVIASSNSFQDGCIKFSQSKHIGLLRYYDGGSFKWELTRSASTLVSYQDAISEYGEALKGIRSETYVSRYFDCYCYVDGDYTNALNAFFHKLLILNAKDEEKPIFASIVNLIVNRKSLVDYKDKATIESLTIDILKSINYEKGEVPLELLCKNENLDLKIEESSKGRILGKITFQPLAVTIFRSDDHKYTRERFTLAHELGHYFLKHSNYMNGEYVEDIDLETDTSYSPYLSFEDLARMEWQANRFASCLLLPKEQLTRDIEVVTDFLGIRDKGFGRIFVDHQRCNIDNFYKVTAILKGKYNVSRQAMTIRLKDLELLNEFQLPSRSRPKSLVHISKI